MTLKTILKLAEPKTFGASVLPVLFGSTFAFVTWDRFSFLSLMLLMTGMILIQSATNMLNDYFDYKKGLDTHDKADEKALLSGEVTLPQLKGLIYQFMGVALIIGLYFAFTIHLGLLAVMLVAVVGMVMYSGGPHPISHTPFGELLAGSLMGTVVTMAVIYIQSGMISWMTFFVTLPTFIFVGLLLLANNLSDWREDEAAGRKTSVIVLGGPEWGRWLWLAGIGDMMLITVLLAVFKVYPVWLPLICLLVLPYGKILQCFKMEKTREHKGQLMKTTTLIGMQYHAAVMAGLLLGKFIG